MDKKTRYQSFDVLKGISCIAVVLIHYPFTGFLSDAGQYIRAACRFAVPVFFAISGFFLPSSDGHITDAGILRKIRHVLRLLIGSGLFYLAFCVAWNVLSNGSFSPYAYILKEIEPWDIVKFVFLNQPFVYSHLWYLLALLYCYTFALLLMKDGKAAKYIAWLAPLLLLGMTLLQEFSAYLPFEATLTFPGTKLQLLIFNTFIFRAMPFFLFGYLARLYREKLNAVKLPNWLLFLLAIIGCAAGGAEHFLIGKSCQFYISTYLSCASMLLLAIKNPEMNNHALAYIGRNLSLYVYILHIAVGKSVDLIFGKMKIGGSTLAIIGRPFVVVSLSLMAAFIAHSIFIKIKIKRGST